MANLQSHFTPTVRAQLPYDNVDGYMAALLELASTCNFGTFCEEMLLDQLKQKTYNNRMRVRLLLEFSLRGNPGNT